MENNLFAIGIPTINRYDLLKPTLDKYLVNFPGTFIFIQDNGHQSIGENIAFDDLYLKENDYLIIYDNPLPSVAASWNFLCNKIFNMVPMALILNDDVFLDHTQQEIMDYLKMDYLNFYTAYDLYTSQKDFCSFILMEETFKIKCGPFDENFKGAYFEDNDYKRRLKLLQARVQTTSFLNPVFDDSFHNSASIQKDPYLNRNFQDNFQYYKGKWGGPVGGEKFNIPFNRLPVR